MSISAEPKPHDETSGELSGKKVSILMPVYNCAEFLGIAINSILSQTYDNWELIICDDGSTDATFSIAKTFRERYPGKIVVLKNNSNIKLNRTLNKCLKRSSGEYIARMDGDDVCHRDRIKIEADWLDKNPKYALVSCQMDLFDADGVFGRANFPQGEIAKQQLLQGPPFCHAGMMLRRDAMLKVGGYSEGEEYLRVEDYDLWFKLYLSGFTGFNLSEVLYSMRDDTAARNRRTFRNRYNEFLVKKRIHKNFDMPLMYFYKVLRPIILGLLPDIIYDKLHRRNVVCRKK